MEELGFLLNFFFHFPFGENSSCPQGIYRTLLVDLWDVSYREIYSRRQEASGIHSLPQSTRFSNKHLDQTPKQFYEDLDLVLSELEICPTKIQELIRVYLKTPHSLRPTDAKSLSGHESARSLNDALVLPYIKMRDLGYNPDELKM